MNKKNVVLIAIMVLLAIAGTVYFAKQAVPPSSADQIGENQSAEASESQEEQKDKESEGVESKEEVVNENVAYISASKLNVRQEPKKDGAVVDSLVKGTKVEIIEEVAAENSQLWYKIRFDGLKDEAEGWISAEHTVKNWTELLSENLKKLDFSPQKKVAEYPDNPRVEVRGIYLTLYSASNSRIDQLIEMAKRTKINAFVIDVKDDNGHMLFPTKAAEKYSPSANAKAPIKDISLLMQKLKENNIYAIARIVSFKDPTYTKHHPDRAIIYRSTGKPFTNSDGLVWATAHDRDLWEYNIAVSKEAAAAGFNEIQFDYVRFPASNGGKLDKELDYRNKLGETKPETIQNYLKYAHEQLSPMQVYIGADIYGLVGSVADDMALGQHWEAVSNVVDYVCPMMYPSHYANGTYGLPVPDAYPYETIYHSTRDSVNRNKNVATPAMIRPWIQDFTAPWVKGYIKYGPKQVEEQIRALEENGITEFMLWNAGNRYSEEAIKN